MHADVALILLLPAVTCVLWWIRERRMSRQRQRTRALYALSGEVNAAASVEEMLRLLLGKLPGISEASAARLYLYNAASGNLEQVTSPLDPEPAVIPVHAAAGPITTACALCFRNRAPFTIRDARRSPFQSAGDPEKPRSVLCVPMLAGEDLLGVLEIDYPYAGRRFSLDEKAAAQQLANQIATSQKLLIQQSLREQLFRNEKVAAAGELIAGMTAQIEAPLESIARRARRLENRQHPADPEVVAMAQEAETTSGLVRQLVELAGPGRTSTSVVDLNLLLAGIIEDRQQDWRARGLRVDRVLSLDRLSVQAVPGQLEYAVSQVLSLAGECAAGNAEKIMTIGSHVLPKRACVEIACAADARESDPKTGAQDAAVLESAGFRVARGILESHGGQLRWTGAPLARFDLDLPLADTARPAPAVEVKRPLQVVSTMTALVVEPDDAARKRLVALLSEYGHRVVPVSNVEEAADLVRRLSFPLVLCSAQLPGSRWVDFFESVRHRVGSFVLTIEGHEPDLEQALQGSHVLVLGKPVEPRQLDQVLDSVSQRMRSR